MNAYSADNLPVRGGLIERVLIAATDDYVMLSDVYLYALHPDDNGDEAYVPRAPTVQEREAARLEMWGVLLEMLCAELIAPLEVQGATESSPVAVLVLGWLKAKADNTEDFASVEAYFRLTTRGARLASAVLSRK